MELGKWVYNNALLQTLLFEAVMHILTPKHCYIISLHLGHFLEFQLFEVHVYIHKVAPVEERERKQREIFNAVALLTMATATVDHSCENLLR